MNWSAISGALGFSSNGFWIALSLALLAVFVTYDSGRVKHGEMKNQLKTEKNNVAATSVADSASRKSLDPAAPGVRNPYYRAD